MDREPTFSVIVPAYNVEPFIGEAVDSVLDQGFGDFELIVVDDGSTDRTPEILAAYEDPRLRVHRVPNQGVGAARNFALDRARGRVLTFLDADDRWRQGKLALENEVLEAEPEVGLVLTNFIRFTPEGDWLSDQFSFYPRLPDIPSREGRVVGTKVITVPPFPELIAFYDFPAYSPAVAVRREVLGELRFPARRYDENGRLVFIEDLAFWPQVFRRTTVAYTDQVFGDVRRHGGNATQDVGRMGYSILGSLKSLRDTPLTPDERRALETRIARQLILVGHEHAKDRELGAALRRYLGGAVGGRPHSALKGLLTLPFRVMKGRASE